MALNYSRTILLFVTWHLIFTLDAISGPFCDSTSISIELIHRTPDKPPVLDSQVSPVYPVGVRLAGVEGQVLMQLFVDTTGNATKIELLKSVHPDLDKEAIKAVQKAKFIPAEYQNRKIGTWVRFPVRFRLREAKKSLNKEPSFQNLMEYRQQASDYQSTERYEQLLALYQQINSEYPEYEDGYDETGRAYQKMERYAEAIRAYTQAILLNPRYILAYLDLAETYRLQKQYSEAIFVYERVIALYGQQASTFTHLGDSYLAMGQYPLALTAYKKAWRLDENFEKAPRGLIIAYEHLGQTKEAQGVYDKAAQQIPRLYQLVGEGYMAQEKYPEALTVYQKARDLKPDCFNTYDYLNWGWANYMVGEFQRCIELTEKAIQKDSLNVAARFNIPLAYLRLGDVARAENIYREQKAFCEANRIPIHKGTIKDLRGLIKENLIPEATSKILTEIFELEPN